MLSCIRNRKLSLIHILINEFAAGIVDIEIRDSGTGEKQRILPGQKLGGPYRIQNNGNDCFVRARFTLRGVRARVVDCITGMDDMWMEGDDGYYYCREVLKEGAFVNLIYGMKIPETLSQAPEGGSFQLDVEVEAVQSKNFRPDFHAVSPWGEVQILQNEKNGSFQSFTCLLYTSNGREPELPGGTVWLAGAESQTVFPFDAGLYRGCYL